MGGDLTAANFRGRTVSRDFLAHVFQSFANLHDPDDPIEKDRLTLARSQFLPFVQEMMPSYKADPFHKHMAADIQSVVDHKTKALMIFAPPQHGKSVQVAQMLPAFWLGQHPELPVLIASYAAARAYDNSRKARSIAMSPMFARLFGGRTPSRDQWRAHDWAFDGLPGFCYGAGLGGAVTGLGFGLGIIDDPHESWEQAQSEQYRKRAWEWYQGTYLSRLWEDAVQVFITTRWHEDDLAGRVLAEEGTVEQGGRWLVRRYPALAEEENKELGIEKDVLGRKPGEPLAPSRYSKKWLLDMRERLGGEASLVWSAEYQQHPTRPAGTLFKVGRIEIEDAAPAAICQMLDGHPVKIIKGVRFWDLAATAEARGKRDPDRTSGTLLAEEPGRGVFWWLDQIAERLDPEQVEDLIVQTAKVDGKGVRIRIEREPAASGKAMNQYYVKLLAGYDVEDIPKGGDTSVLATPMASQINVGNFRMLKGDWNKATLQELAQFPSAPHDDRVVSAAGAFNDITENRTKFRDQKFAKV